MYGIRAELYVGWGEGVLNVNALALADVARMWRNFVTKTAQSALCVSMTTNTSGHMYVMCMFVYEESRDDCRSSIDANAQLSNGNATTTTAQ